MGKNFYWALVIIAVVIFSPKDRNDDPFPEPPMGPTMQVNK